MIDHEPIEPNPIVLHENLRNSYLRMFGYTFQKGPYMNSAGEIERIVHVPRPSQNLVDKILNPNFPEHPLTGVRRAIKTSLVSDPLKASIVSEISSRQRYKQPPPNEHPLYDLLGLSGNIPLAFDDKYVQDLSRSLLHYFSTHELQMRALINEVGIFLGNSSERAELYKLARNDYIECYSEEP